MRGINRDFLLIIQDGDSMLSDDSALNPPKQATPPVESPPQALKQALPISSEVTPLDNKGDRGEISPIGDPSSSGHEQQLQASSSSSLTTPPKGAESGSNGSIPMQTHIVKESISTIGTSEQILTTPTSPSATENKAVATATSYAVISTPTAASGGPGKKAGEHEKLVPPSSPAGIPSQQGGILSRIRKRVTETAWPTTEVISESSINLRDSNMIFGHLW